MATSVNGRSVGGGRTRLGPAALVTTSQLSMAGGGYLVLVLAARPLDDAAALAALTAFYLLLNTVGRGLCSATELHLTRTVAAELAAGRPLGPVTRAGRRQAAALLALALLATAVTALLLRAAFGGSWLMVGLLAASLPGMAEAYRQRGMLAGERRYGRYGLSFAAEGVATVSLAVVVLVAGGAEPEVWALPLALGPTVSVLVLAVTRGAARVPWRGAQARTDASGLGWSVLILGGSQAVWNLPPVILTARPEVAPAAAAAFASLAVVLRIPVLGFPAVQALLLPALTRRPGGAGLLRRVPPGGWAALTGAAGLWLAAGALLAPTAVTWLFGLDEPLGLAVALVLAAATLVGGASILAQTNRVAAGDFRTAGLAWSAALVVVVAVGALAPASPAVAALSLLGGILVAAAALVFAVPTQRSRR